MGDVGITVTRSNPGPGLGGPGRRRVIHVYAFRIEPGSSTVADASMIAGQKG